MNVLNSGLDDKDSLLSKPSRDPSLMEEKWTGVCLNYSEVKRFLDLKRQWGDRARNKAGPSEYISNINEHSELYKNDEEKLLGVPPQTTKSSISGPCSSFNGL